MNPRCGAACGATAKSLMITLPCCRVYPGNEQGW